jgi:putative hemolysin
MAESTADVRAAQTLRFLVFNLEMNEGLEASYATLRDEDPFDAICDHLLVEEEATGDIVGTYRLQTGTRAAANLGFYSSQEFDLFALEPLRPQLVELGRACVHIRHRNLAVLALLWKGIAAYARQRGGRYLIGCSSLSSTDAKVGASAYSHLMRRHLVDEPFQIRPQVGWECPLDQLAEETPKIPRLLTAYLSFGAKICGQPAIDREFRTIDFFTLLDLQTLPEETVNRFLK